MPNFEIYLSNNFGTDWSSTSPSIDGTFPVLLQDYYGRIFCFYIKEDDDQYNLVEIHTNDNGDTWSDANTIREDIIEAEIGATNSINGRIVVVYWKEDGDDEKRYMCWSNDSGTTWDASDEVEVS